MFTSSVSEPMSGQGLISLPLGPKHQESTVCLMPFFSSFFSFSYVYSLEGGKEEIAPPNSLLVMVN